MLIHPLKINRRIGPNLWWACAISLIAAFTLTATRLDYGLVDCTVAAAIANAVTPNHKIDQAVNVAGRLILSMPTGSWRAVAPMTLLQTANAPTSARELSNIYFPLVAKEGTPYPFNARLPLLANATNSPPNAEFPYTRKTIVVDISEQHVYAYEKGKLIFSFTASTGRNHLTRPGHYRVLDKIPNAYSQPWGFWMPYWMGIYYVGYDLENGFHSLPVLSNGTELWGSKIGSPVTYGCVVLLPDDMRKLFRWARVGTAVVIQK